MEQTKALNALEPFLALSKSATSPRAAADLVIRATSSPNTFIFTELLQTPQIQSLSQSNEYAPHLALLEMFSWGTYSDYNQQRQPKSLPDLNDAQTLKLRQLSLLSLASDRSNLAYGQLQSSLSLPDARALEALVTSAIYAGLLSATLDPARQCVHVNALSPLRDLAPGAVPDLAQSLRAWSDRCTTTLADIEGGIAKIRRGAAQRQEREAAHKLRLEKLIKETKGKASDPLARRHKMRGPRGRMLNKRGSSLMDGPDDEDDEAMELDVEEVEDQKRASRRKL